MGPDPVVLDFAVRGLADVGRAFDSVSARMARLEKDSTRQSEQGSKQRIKSAEQEAKLREREAARVQKAVERAERQQTREAEAEARRRQGIVRKSSEMAGRYAAEQARTEQREAEKATRAIEREAERRQRIQQRSAEMAGRLAARQAAEEIAAQKRSHGIWGARGRRIGGIAAGSVGSLVGGAASIATATLGIGGGMMLADAARREMSAQQQAALLVNTVTTGSVAPQGASVNAILGQAGQMSKELGIDKTELIGGALEYSRKARGGDFRGAMANMGFFAKMAQVTGADINDIASAAGTLQSQNPSLDAKGMQQMLLDVYAQGKQGSMSMVDVAKQMGTLASTRSSFQGDMATNQRKLLALGQLAAPEGTVEEAGTYIKDLSQALSKPKDLATLKRWGVRTDKFGAVESPENLVESVFRGSGGDMSKIAAVFGARGVPLFRALEGSFKGAGGGEAGISAVLQQMATVTGATMTPEQLQAQHAQIMDTPAEKMKVALNKMTETIGEKLEPKMAHFADVTLPKLMPVFESIIDEASKFADWFADNPIKGVGAIVLAAITKDLAAAGIGAAVRAAIGALLSSAAGGGAVASGASRLAAGAGGAAGVALPVALAGAAGGVAAMYAVNKDVEGQANAQRAGISRILEDTNLASRIRGGKATAADIAKAQAEATSLEGAWSQKGKEITNPKLSGDEWLTVGLAKVTGQGDKADELIAAKQRAAAKEYELMGATVRDLTAALANLSKTASSADPKRNVPIAQRPAL